jgi:hypothetical protein
MDASIHRRKRTLGFADFTDIVGAKGKKEQEDDFD